MVERKQKGNASAARNLDASVAGINRSWCVGRHFHVIAVADQQIELVWSGRRDSGLNPKVSQVTEEGSAESVGNRSPGSVGTGP
jgi:hypothetical protein